MQRRFYPSIPAPPSVATEAPESTRNVDRRTLLRLAILSGAGLVLGGEGLGAPSVMAAAPLAKGDLTPFVQLAPDGSITVICKHLDMGQGIATGLATLVAEELDADWTRVRSEFAPTDTETYKNLAFGIQATGGSLSIANSFDQYRTAGAAARSMIIAAAARKWNVPPESVSISKSIVSSGKNRADLGELASAAAKEAIPEKPKLKDPSQYVLIGKENVGRIDSPLKTVGNRLFTQDVQLPEMLIATLMRPLRFGGKVDRVDDKAARAVKGVVDVVTVPQGVAVLATSTYAAIKARQALSVVWDDRQAELRGTEQIISDYRDLSTKAGIVAKGAEVETAFATAHKVIEAEYVFPFLAHAPMEPLNAVVQYKDGKVTIWSGSQAPTIDQSVAAEIFGRKPQDVSINTLWAGGSFGRRSVYNADYVAEAASIVKASRTHRPLKLIWTREDDIRGGYYRPLYVHKVKVALDQKGAITGWLHRIVGQSMVMGTTFEAALVKNGVDETTVTGVTTTPYAIPNMRVEVHNTKAGPPPLWWRSIGQSHTIYVMETMLDEIAQHAGVDPLSFRMSLLDHNPRLAAVLKLAAEKSGWGQPPPEGVFRGIAVTDFFSSYIAQIAELRISEGSPKVERVVAAVDCGLPINPDNIRSQVEGGIGYGLGAILKGKVTLKDGYVEQGNFDTYEVLRMHDMPRVEVHVIPSAAPPTGVGELGTPPIGPAVANAIAAGTGKRVRVLPISDGLKLA